MMILASVVFVGAGILSIVGAFRVVARYRYTTRTLRLMVIGNVGGTVGMLLLAVLNWNGKDPIFWRFAVPVGSALILVSALHMLRASFRHPA